MRLLSLRIWNFRNLAPARIDCSPGVNLVGGGNGEGKTNFLEAISVLGNLRSFRSPHVRRLVRHGETAFRISGEIESFSGRYCLQQVVEVGTSIRRSLKVDGVEVDMARYLGLLPVFCLARSDRDLVTGGPDVRRAFLDRAAFLVESRHLRHMRDYERALRQRNAALFGRADDEEIRGWERQLARSGALVVSRRLEVVELLVAVFTDAYRRLAHRGFPEIEIGYRTGSSIAPEIYQKEGCAGLEELYFQRYNESRARDRRAGFTFEGPHRHDLSLRGDGRPVRDVLSSGQIKIVAAALRLAGLTIVEQARGEILPVIVDDIDAELDDRSLSRLIGWLGGDRQTFFSSASEILSIDDISWHEGLSRGSYAVRGGLVVRVGGQGHG